MATLTRWAPLRDTWRLQDEVNRLFDLTTRLTPEGEALANGWVPPVDIYEDAEGVTLKVEVPGLSASDIDVRIENSTLTLKGERKIEKEDRKENYRRVERYYGAFSRSFTLPTTVDTEKVHADAKNGVLSVFLPKREETKPKQIKVNVN
jgi:HSP20 family protein